MTSMLPLRLKIVGPLKGEWGIIYTRKPGKLTITNCEGLIPERFTSRAEARTWYRHNILGIDSRYLRPIKDTNAPIRQTDK
jgi:hypothetical protein